MERAVLATVPFLGIGLLVSLPRVGFGPNGEWIVDASVLMRRVLPFDIAAAMMAIAALLYGMRRQAIEQARPQS